MWPAIASGKNTIGTRTKELSELDPIGEDKMIISELGLSPTSLKNEIAIITGAGGGIGYEAARALLWLGTNVVIAEIDQPGGERAAHQLAEEFEQGRVLFVNTDVGDEKTIKNSDKE